MQEFPADADVRGDAWWRPAPAVTETEPTAADTEGHDAPSGAHRRAHEHPRAPPHTRAPARPSLLALIKDREKTYTAVVGTMKEALYVIHDDTLENTQSRALRAMIVINNGYDVDRCTI